MYKETLERVTTYFAGEKYMGELTLAKDEYFKKTGKIFDDEPFFESRMSAFFEWYLFDRTLVDHGVPPVRLYNMMYGGALEREEQQILKGMERTIHSLFLFLGRDGEKFRVRDLRNDAEYDVKERRHYGGIERGDILDARVVRYGDRVIFSDALWFYPHAARDFILEECKRRRTGPKDGFQALLFDLAYMKLKQERYQHVPTEQIYEWNSLRRDRGELERRNA